MATVELKSIRKSYATAEVIRGIDLTIKDRELTVFVGPSGCGKSTLLRMIAGLEDITSGDLFIDGERVNDVAPDKRGLALVFQSYALYPHMSVADNMAFSLKLAGVSKKERIRKVTEAARVLHLESYLERKPRDLSGGQRQRVAIGRAIVRNPRVFLFDEPLSNLDAALRVKMRLELTRLHAELNATMIYVTHDQIEAMTMADRIVVLQGGAIEQVGEPMELYRSPRNQFVAGFIGSPRMNFLPVRSQVATPEARILTLFGGTSLSLPATNNPLDSGSRIATLGIRPEHISLGAANGLPVHVQMVERLGGESYVYVDLPGEETLIVRSTGDVDVRPGQQVYLTFHLAFLHLFDESGNTMPKPNQNPVLNGSADGATQFLQQEGSYRVSPDRSEPGQSF